MRVIIALFITLLFPFVVFVLAVQQGNRLDDLRRNNNIAFKANKSGKLDLTILTKQSLDGVEWLTPRKVAQPHEPYSIKKATYTWLRIALMSTGVILVVTGLLMRLFKK